MFRCYNRNNTNKKEDINMIKKIETFLNNNTIPFDIIYIITLCLIVTVPLSSRLSDSLLIINILLIIVLFLCINWKFPLAKSSLLSIMNGTTLVRIIFNILSVIFILLKAKTLKITDYLAYFVKHNNFYVFEISFFAIFSIVSFMLIHKVVKEIVKSNSRFSENRLPAKMLIIDADLATGKISEAQACDHRHKLEVLVDFHNDKEKFLALTKLDATINMFIAFLLILVVIVACVIKANINTTFGLYLHLLMAINIVYQIFSLIFSILHKFVIENIDKFIAHPISHSDTRYFIKAFVRRIILIFM